MESFEAGTLRRGPLFHVILYGILRGRYTASWALVPCHSVWNPSRPVHCVVGPCSMSFCMESFEAGTLRRGPLFHVILYGILRGRYTASWPLVPCHSVWNPSRPVHCVVAPCSMSFCMESFEAGTLRRGPLFHVILYGILRGRYTASWPLVPCHSVWNPSRPVHCVVAPCSMSFCMESFEAGTLRRGPLFQVILYGILRGRYTASWPLVPSHSVWNPSRPVLCVVGPCSMSFCMESFEASTLRRGPLFHVILYGILRGRYTASWPLVPSHSVWNPSRPVHCVVAPCSKSFCMESFEAGTLRRGPLFHVILYGILRGQYTASWPLVPCHSVWNPSRPVHCVVAPCSKSFCMESFEAGTLRRGPLFQVILYGILRGRYTASWALVPCHSVWNPSRPVHCVVAPCSMSFCMESFEAGTLRRGRSKSFCMESFEAGTLRRGPWFHVILYGILRGRYTASWPLVPCHSVWNPSRPVHCVVAPCSKSFCMESFEAGTLRRGPLFHVILYGILRGRYTASWPLFPCHSVWNPSRPVHCVVAPFSKSFCMESFEAGTLRRGPLFHVILYGILRGRYTASWPLVPCRSAWNPSRPVHCVVAPCSKSFCMESFEAGTLRRGPWFHVILYGILRGRYTASWALVPCHSVWNPSRPVHCVVAACSMSFCMESFEAGTLRRGPLFQVILYGILRGRYTASWPLVPSHSVWNPSRPVHCVVGPCSMSFCMESFEASTLRRGPLFHVILYGILRGRYTASWPLVPSHSVWNPSRPVHCVVAPCSKSFCMESFEAGTLRRGPLFHVILYGILRGQYTASWPLVPCHSVWNPSRPVHCVVAPCSKSFCMESFEAGTLRRGPLFQVILYGILRGRYTASWALVPCHSVWNPSRPVHCVVAPCSMSFCMESFEAGTLRRGPLFHVILYGILRGRYTASWALVPCHSVWNPSRPVHCVVAPGSKSFCMESFEAGTLRRGPLFHVILYGILRGRYTASWALVPCHSVWNPSRPVHCVVGPCSMSFCMESFEAGTLRRGPLFHVILYGILRGRYTASWPLVPSHSVWNPSRPVHCVVGPCSMSFCMESFEAGTLRRGPWFHVILYGILRGRYTASWALVPCHSVWNPSRPVHCVVAPCSMSFCMESFEAGTLRRGPVPSFCMESRGRCYSVVAPGSSHSNGILRGRYTASWALSSKSVSV